MGIMINASAELRAGCVARTARASRRRRAHYLRWRIYWMRQSEINVWESSLLGLEFLLKWQSEFKTLLTFPVRRESVNAMYRVEINAWQMERFSNPMHLVHVSIWWRADKEHLERGCEAWEVIGRTFSPSHSNGRVVPVFPGHYDDTQDRPVANCNVLQCLTTQPILQHLH